MAINDVALLHRYLNATRWEWLPVDDPILVDAAASVATKGFPGIDLDCSFVFLRSRNRRCEYRPIGSHHFVVIDLDLSDRLMELDLLVQISAMKPDWVYAFFVVLLGDAFRQLRDFNRYRYCVLKAFGDIQSLQKLSSLPKEGPPIHAAIAPVILHELAHIAFRRNEDFVGPLRDLCRATLSKFADLSAEHAATGREPVPGGVTLGVPFEQFDQARLKRQQEQYAATIRNNAELEEELTCDFIAALAFINLEAKTNSFLVMLPQSMPLSIRQLGDIYYLAIKTSRYLQLITGVTQLGSNIVTDLDDLHRSIIEMTARTNALTHLLQSMFRLQVEGSAFHAKPDFGQPLSNEQVFEGMYRSMVHLMRQHHNKLLGPFEILSEFFVTQEAFDKDNREVLSRFLPASLNSFDEVDEVRRKLPF